MSTRPDDRLINVLSHWLARHVDDEELREVDELREELGRGEGSGKLEMVVRETLEALALG